MSAIDFQNNNKPVSVEFFYIKTQMFLARNLEKSNAKNVLCGDRSPMVCHIRNVRIQMIC